MNFAIWPFETCRGSCFSSRRLDVCLHYSHPDFFKNIFFQFHSSDQQWSCQETSRAFAVHTVCVSSVKGCGLEEHMCVCFTPAVQTCLPLTPDDVNLYFFEVWTFSVRWGSLCAYLARGCSSQRCGNSASCWSFWSRGGHRPDAAACSADVPECTLPACRGNMLHGSAGGKATCHFTHTKLREVKHHVTPVISEFYQPHRLRVEDKSKTCSSSNAHKGLQQRVSPHRLHVKTLQQK